MSQFVTGEAVAVNVPTAGIPSRLLAAAIDGAIQLTALTLLFLLLGSISNATSEAGLLATSLVVLVVVALGYPVGCETLMRGRTPGKAAMGLRVVRDDAGPIGFRQAFVRGLVGFIVERPGFTFYSAAVISSLLSRHGKRLGDFAAGTVVVQERVAGKQPVPVLMPPPLAGWASTLDLSGLSDELALSVRTFLSRWPTLTAAARTDLGDRLCHAVGAVVTPPAPPGTPGWAYLSAVLAERRMRAERGLHAGYGGPAGAPVAAPAPPMAATPPVAEVPRPAATTRDGFHAPG